MASNSSSLHRNSNNIRKTKLLRVLLVLLVFGLIIFIIFMLTKGKTTVSGSYPESEINSSLVCTKKGAKYSKINDTDSNDKEVAVTAIFDGKSNLKTISLKYTVRYSTEEEATQAEALAHFDFGSHLGNYGFSFDEFDNKFSIIDNALIVSIYDDKKAVESVDRAGYFMLGDEVKSGKDLKKLTALKSVFEKKGYTCEASTDNK